MAFTRKRDKVAKVDDEARIADIRRALSRHDQDLELTPHPAVAMVEAAGEWTARILHERTRASAGIEATRSTRREAAEQAFNKFDLLHSERQSLASREAETSRGASESDTPKEPGAS